MHIHGLTKTTLLDYPGHVASTVFTAGCNFRCPFCHNGHLVLDPDIYPRISEDEVLSHLKKRKNILSGVCITGGEPTLQPDLSSFICQIKELGLLVKLDTNGYRPDVIKSLLEDKLIDYVAMDIKAALKNYDLATGVKVDNKKILESIDLLNNSNLPHEFRTTCVKGIHTAYDFDEISKMLPSDSFYFLQNFKGNENVIDANCQSFSIEEMNHFKDLIIDRLPNTKLRGIE